MKDYLPTFAENIDKGKIRLLNAAVLSFVGDSVQTLFVRTELALEETSNTNALHKKAAAKINATAQAEAARRIQAKLTEIELDVFKRCRNYKTQTVAKNALVTDYKTASGLEGLIGYLYLAGEHDRLNEILDLGYSETLLK
jgi:ribonuclease-3 family protein